MVRKQPKQSYLDGWTQRGPVQKETSTELREEELFFDSWIESYEQRKDMEEEIVKKELRVAYWECFHEVPSVQQMDLLML